MTRTNAQMFITGPQVIKAVTGREVSMDDVGGAAMHAAVSGNVHILADDDRHAIELAQQLLSYLPSNNTDDPPHMPRPEIDFDPDEGIDALVKSDAVRADGHARHSSAACSTTANCSRSTPSFAKNLIVGFGRIEGIVVGVHRQQLDGEGRLPRHRLLRQGRPLHPLLQRLQHPARHLRRRAGLPARHRPGARRHHPPRRQDAVRLRGRHRAEDHHGAPARPMAAPTSPCAARRWAPTWCSPGRPPRSR